MHVFDRQTDGQTDRQLPHGWTTLHASMQRSKKPSCHRATLCVIDKTSVVLGYSVHPAAMSTEKTHMNQHHRIASRILRAHSVKQSAICRAVTERFGRRLKLYVFGQ